MMRWGAVAAVSALVLGTGAAHAQTRTLEDALSAAYSGNPTLQRGAGAVARHR